jgi:CheY-like chemotaxis protein
MATRVFFTPSVLLVNDEREMHALTLRAAGYRIIKAENSLAAYQIAAIHPPDIVVTDVRMTGSISGLELTRRLRNNQRTSAVGIIVLTTVSRPQDADVALKAGADVFLEKPVPGSVLKAEIARVLQSSQFFRRSARTLDLRAMQSMPLTSTDDICPRCDSPIAYRERWPILTSDDERSTNGRERIRYVADGSGRIPLSACLARRLAGQPVAAIPGMKRSCFPS